MREVRNDPAVFGVLFDRHYQQILRYCVRRTGDVAIAEDLTSDVFMKALQAVKRYEWRGVSVQAWLYKIATNELRMYYRRAKRQTISLEQLSDEYGIEPISDVDIEREAAEAQDVIDRNHEFMHALEIMGKLPMKYQEVLTLRFVERKKVADIAHIIGRKEGTVKSLISRGVAKLRQEMQPNTRGRIVSSEDHNSYQQSPERNV